MNQMLNIPKKGKIQEPDSTLPEYFDEFKQMFNDFMLLKSGQAKRQEEEDDPDNRRSYMQNKVQKSLQRKQMSRQNQRDNPLLLQEEESGYKNPREDRSQDASKIKINKELSFNENESSLQKNDKEGSALKNSSRKDQTPQSKLKASSSKQIDDQDEKNDIDEFTQKYLRFGDIICLTYFDKFQNIDGATQLNQPKINSPDNTQLDPNGIKIEVKSESQEQKQSQDQQSMNDFQLYKGVLWSDSVTNKNLNVIPKVPQNQENLKFKIAGENFSALNGSQQFSKCLFRIETAQEYEQSIILYDLQDKLAEKDLELERVNENPKYLSLEKEKMEIEDKIKHLQQSMDDEKRNNEYELQVNLGKKITYGQKIQLKHIFSGHYLTINKKQIAEENGCVAMQLSEPNKDSQFTLTPSQKIRQIGQPVPFMDFFYLQHYDIDHQLDKYQFFMHVATDSENSNDHQIFEVNGSYEPSRFKAKLFIDYQNTQREENLLYSGDSIKLMHQELESYLTVESKAVENYIECYPDFLEDEKLKLLESNQQNFQAQQIKTQQNLDNLNSKRNGYKIRRDPIQQKIYIERDPEQLIESNCYWEIQKLRPFQGGPIEWDECYRIKHIGTGKFLATSLENGKAKLYLREIPDPYDTVFIIRRSIYQITHKDKLEPIKNENHIMLESYYQKFIQVENLDELFNEHEYFLEPELQKDSIANIQHTLSFHTPQGVQTPLFKNTSKDFTKSLAKEKLVKEPSQEFDQPEEPESSTGVDVLPGDYIKHEVAKMLFKIQKMPQEDAHMSYQGSNFFDYFTRFYHFLNSWAVSVNHQQPLINAKDHQKSKEQQFQYFYNAKEAVKLEDELIKKSEELYKALENLQKILSSARDIHQSKYLQIQNYLAEQGNIHIIVKLIELIYFKTTEISERQKPFEKLSEFKSQITLNHTEDQESVYQIAKDHLHEIQDMLLKTVYLLIKQNVKNSSLVTEFDDIFFIQLNHHDTSILASIFKETYKRAQQILGDENLQNNTELKEHGSSNSKVGNNSQMSLQIQNSQKSIYMQHHVSSLQKVSSQYNPSGYSMGSVSKMEPPKLEIQKHQSSMNTHFNQANQYEGKIQRWSSLIDMISYKDKNDETLAHQILFMQVISMMCADTEGRGIYKYQMEAVYELFGSNDKQKPQSNNYAPIKLQVEEDTQKVNILFLMSKDQKSFESQNPLLKKNKSNVAVKAKDNQNKQQYYSFDLTKMSLKQESKIQDYEDLDHLDFQPYIEYIITAIKLYTNLCVSSNYIGIYRLKEIGFTYENIIKIVCYSQQINQQIKAAMIDLARVLFVDSDEFLANYNSFTRLYPWVFIGQQSLKQVNKNEPITEFSHQSIYAQEKKYFEQKEAECTDSSNIKSDFQFITNLICDKDDEIDIYLKSRHQQDHLTEEQAIEMRKLITDFFFHETQIFDCSNLNLKQGSKQLQEDIQVKIDTKLKLLHSYMDLATSLIKTQHVDYNFVNDMIKMAAIIFVKYDIEDFNEPTQTQANIIKHKTGINNNPNYKNYHNSEYKIQDISEIIVQIMPNQENEKKLKRSKLYDEFRKSFKVLEFLEVAEKQKDYRNKIDTLEVKTLKMLQHLCKLRVDSQIIIFIKIFKSVLEKNGHQGDFNQKQQLNLLFNIFQFQNEKKDFKTSQQLKDTLQEIFKQNPLANYTPEEEKRIENLQDPFKIEFYKQILQLTSQVSSQSKKIEKDDHKDKHKSSWIVCGKDKEKNSKYDIEQEQNQEFVLFKLLLFSIFKQTKNTQIKDEAANVLVLNFRQQTMLFEEISRIDILISYQDQEDYLFSKLKSLHLNYHINQIISLNNFERDKFYQNNHDGYMKLIKKHLSGIENILESFIFQIQRSNERQARVQSFLRHLDFHGILINQFLKKIDLSNVEESSLFLKCYKIISYFLLAFSFNNAKNQKSLLPHLNFLLNQMDMDEEYAKSNQNLIASILWRNKHTDEGSLFMHFLLKKIESKKFFNSRMLKILNLMTFDSDHNQSIILKKLVQERLFFIHLKDISHELKDSFDEILKFEKQPFRLDADYIKFKHSELLQMHFVKLEIISNCANNNLYGILQARKILPAHFILKVLQSDKTPLLAKRYYFRLLFQVYINEHNDISTMDLKTPQFLDILESILTTDILQLIEAMKIQQQSPNKYLDASQMNTTMDNIQEEENEKSEESDSNRLIDDQSKINFLPDILSKTQKKYSKVPELDANMKNLMDCNNIMRFLALFKQRQNRPDGFLYFIADFFRSFNSIKYDKSSQLVTIVRKYKSFVRDLEVYVDASIKLVSSFIEKKIKSNLAHSMQNQFDAKEPYLSLFNLRQTGETQRSPNKNNKNAERKNVLHTNIKKMLPLLNNIKIALDKVKEVFPKIQQGTYNKGLSIASDKKFRDEDSEQEDSIHSHSTEIDTSKLAQKKQNTDKVIDQVKQYLNSQNIKISQLVSQLKKDDEEMSQDEDEQDKRRVKNLKMKVHSYLSPPNINGEILLNQIDREKSDSQYSQLNSDVSSRSFFCLYSKKPKNVNQGDYANEEHKNAKDVQNTVISDKKLHDFIKDACQNLPFEDIHTTVEQITLMAMQEQKKRKQRKEEEEKISFQFKSNLGNLFSRKNQQFENSNGPVDSSSQQSKLNLPQKHLSKQNQGQKQMLKQNIKEKKQILLIDLEVIFASDRTIALLPEEYRLHKEGFVQEQELHFQTSDYTLSFNCKQDFSSFVKYFEQFCKGAKINDELNELIENIKAIFDYSFENNKTEVIKSFIENMIKSFEDSDHRIYLMKILNMLLEKYMESNISKKDKLELNHKLIYNKRLHRLQNTMCECNILHLLLGLIHKDEKLEVSNEAIKLLCSLLCESNDKIQEQFLNILKTNRKEFNLLEFIKDRLKSSTEELIRDTIEQLQTFGKDEHQRLTQNISTQKQKVSSKFQAKEGGSRMFRIIAGSKKSFIDSQEQDTHQDWIINMLKLIQLLCDNCYQPFQNYLINQDITYKRNGEKEEIAEDSKDIDKITINILIEIANVLIRLTTKLDIIIFSDFNLYQTISQIFDTLIDFLHGPCQQAQKILCNWKKFMKCVNFYMKQDMGFYSPTSSLLTAKQAIFTRCVSLLIALIETDNDQFRKEQLQEIVREISIENMKKKMVEIFIYKVGVGEKRKRIYTANKKCTHFQQNQKIDPKQPNKSQKPTNACKEGEYCQENHLIKSDKKIINAGFDLFIFLQNLYNSCPEIPSLQDCDFTIKNQKTYKELTSKYMPILQLQASRNVIHHKMLIEKEEVQYNDKMWEKALKLNNQADPRAEYQKNNVSARDLKHKTTGEHYPEQLEPKKYRAFCCRKQNRTHNVDMRRPTFAVDQSRNYSTNQYNSGVNLQETEKLNKNSNIEYEGQEQKIGKVHKKESFNFQSQQIFMYQSLSQDNDHEQDYLFSSEDGYINDFLAKLAQIKQDPEYSFDQFKLDTAIRFYIRNVAQIEIIYKGNLVKVMFKIPSYCEFMGQNARKQMIYGSQNRFTQSDKLEDFFTRIHVIKTEMKSRQRLQRVSRVKMVITNNWGGMQAVSLGIIIIINILFLVFYATDQASDTIYLTNPWAEVAVQILTLIQALLSFIIVVSYFIKYNEVFWVLQHEQVKVVKKKWFTQFKGTLGYAFGQSTQRLQSENEQKLKASLSETSKIIHKPKMSAFKKDLHDINYWFLCFFMGLWNDIRFLFNVLYFCASVIGIYKYFLFSFLLLDIIIKIPLLESVVQAINQNKTQIFYTMLLLFMIIYIYSFIAFINFRSSYVYDQQSNNIQFNTYCDSLVMCFTSTLNNGLRAGGGIGDVLWAPLETDQDYWGRWVFDLTFFVIIIVIMLNLIFGIIIDAFAAMRDDRNKVEMEVREKCYICGISRFNFEAKNKSFQEHVLKEHNAYAYLYFVMYVQKKPFHECTGVEKYVKALALAEDPMFFPINASLSLQEAELEEKILYKQN